jgi:hypothetical protein
MPPLVARLRDAAAPVVAAAFGIAWFAANGGLPVLDPTNVAWLLGGGDPAQHWLGWAFYRTAPLASFPLGAIPGYVYPVGSSVAFTDAIPILAILLRPFAPWLPVHFQYLGPWLALCFALQGFFGAKLVSTISDSRLIQALGGMMFVLSPVLLWRLGHEALCAQWIILAMMWLAIGKDSAGAPNRRTMSAVLVLGVLSAAIHPFIAALTAALTLALVIRWSLGPPRIVRRAAIAFLLCDAAAMAVVLAVLGYIGGAPLAAKGYGYFSSDLLTLVNPMGWSHVLPTFPTRPGQYEGYGFVGTGVLLLGIIGVVVAVIRGEHPFRDAWRRARPVILIVAMLACFAVTTKVTFAGRKLFGTSSLPQVLAAVVAPFRSTGRFIWPLHELAILGAVAIAVRAARGGPRAALVLAAAVLIQAVDLGSHLVRPVFAAKWAPPELEEWAAASGNVTHLVLVPQRILDADGAGCVAGEPVERDPRLAYLAYRLGLSFNSGYLSRVDTAAAVRTCAALDASLARGELDPASLYVLSTGTAVPFPPGAAVCGRIGEWSTCVSSRHRSPLRDALAQSQHEVVPGVP